MMVQSFEWLITWGGCQTGRMVEVNSVTELTQARLKYISNIGWKSFWFDIFLMFQDSVNPFHVTGHFLDPMKHQETRVFMIFSGGIE